MKKILGIMVASAILLAGCATTEKTEASSGASAKALPAPAAVGTDKAFAQYQLPYAFDALEGNIDTVTMQTHYGKHHAGYTNTLNNAAEQAGVADRDIVTLLSSLNTIADAGLRNTIRNNGGGYYNHNLYFSTMAPNAGGTPTGTLADKINSTFGSFDEFKKQLSAAATGRFGSGWAWLSTNRNGDLIISSSPNQDNPIIEGTGNIPILGIDVWEHAYYLKYKNVRADYVAAFFNVIDWDAVQANYDNAF